MSKKSFDPARTTEAQQSALEEAKRRNQEDYQNAFKAGYADALENRPMHGFPNKNLNAAYQSGYFKGGKGLAIKL